MYTSQNNTYFLNGRLVRVACEYTEFVKVKDFPGKLIRLTFQHIGLHNPKNKRLKHISYLQVFLNDFHVVNPKNYGLIRDYIDANYVKKRDKCAETPYYDCGLIATHRMDIDCVVASVLHIAYPGSPIGNDLGYELHALGYVDRIKNVDHNRPNR